MKRIARVGLAMVFVCGIGATANADEVTDWNEQMLRAALIAGTNPTSTTRVAAMVQAAMFDAVNGINPRYTHIYVPPAAPAGASRRAAAVQAAYAMLSKLYGAAPANAPQVAFDARRIISLDEIAGDESAASIASGVAWGQSVADQIFVIRSTDGFSNTAVFPDNLNIGQWRRTPNLPVSSTLSAAGAGYLMVSTQVPWVLTTPMQFRPGPPPAVTSPQYAKDFNEAKTMGSQFSPARSPALTANALFWNAGTASYLWNQVALTLIEKNNHDRDRNDDWSHGQRSTLLENAKLFAAIGLSMADAAIACWDAKYEYHYWRPITAIRETADDGNPATTPDPTWVPMFATPGHPEYPSGHSCISGAAAAVLSDEFGERTRFKMTSDLMFGYEQSYRNINEALEAVKDARVFAGIHFRTATEVGQALGKKVAEFVLQERFQRIH
jgi:PAP2 superfamily protein